MAVAGCHCDEHGYVWNCTMLPLVAHCSQNRNEVYVPMCVPRDPARRTLHKNVAQICAPLQNNRGDVHRDGNMRRTNTSSTDLCMRNVRCDERGLPSRWVNSGLLRTDANENMVWRLQVCRDSWDCS